MIYLSFSRIFSCLLLYCLFIILSLCLSQRLFRTKARRRFSCNTQGLYRFPLFYVFRILRVPRRKYRFQRRRSKDTRNTEFSAMSETLLGSLPNRVCLSVLPSPVITASERRILSSSDAALASTSNPLWSSQFKRRISRRRCRPQLRLPEDL